MSRSPFHDDDRVVIVERHSSGVSHLLMGMAIGACAALLLAPQSGAETRRDIRRRALRVRRAAEDAVQGVADTVSETVDGAKRGVAERIDSVRDEIELKRRQFNRAMDAGRDAAREARGELEGRLAETKAAYDAGADVVRSARAGRRPAGDATDQD